MRPKPRQDDEFTVADLFYSLRKEGAGYTFESVRMKLDRMVKSGKYEKRKVNLNGHIANLYRLIRPD